MVTCCGTGSPQGLGLELARQLVRAGCRHLVLASRNPELPMEQRKEFAAAGVAVHVKKVDAGDPVSVDSLLLWVHQNLPPIWQYAAAAGVSGDTPLAQMTHDDFWAVARPKVRQCQAYARIVHSPTQN